MPITPDVPTARDAAGADVLIPTSWSLHARAGTPADVTSKLQAALVKVLGALELQEWTSSRGMRARASAGREVEARSPPTSNGCHLLELRIEPLS